MVRPRQMHAYSIMAELVRRHHEQPFPSFGDLTPYELGLFSQNGEDGVLAELLRRIGPGNRYFVEFGVESGREGNCVFLADVMRWSGLFMEASGKFYSGLAGKYRSNPRVETRQAFVSPNNIDQLLTTSAVPAEPDVLSIDIDGNDFWVWSALEAIRPRIVTVEYNAQPDPHSRLVQPYVEDWVWDGTDFYGASIGALRWLGLQKGYRLVHTELAGVNSFFVREDLLDQFADLSLESVPLRSPNFWLNGEGHPPDTLGRKYLNLDLRDVDEELIGLANGPT